MHKIKTLNTYMAVEGKTQRNYFKTFEHISPTFPSIVICSQVSSFISK